MDFSYDKKMGAKIRELRLKSGMTQEMLSAKLQLQGCDISRGGLSKIEIGTRHIYAVEIKAFKNIFDVPYEDLFV